MTFNQRNLLGKKVIIYFKSLISIFSIFNFNYSLNVEILFSPCYYWLFIKMKLFILRRKKHKSMRFHQKYGNVKFQD